jgi:hypothetical protein
MSDLTVICNTCQTPVQQQFTPGTGLRQKELINADLIVTDQCFVRDEIEFSYTGRLIFAPQSQEGKRYLDQYAVICRKLTVNGGNKPITIVPCNPADPGTQYDQTNAITWLNRLHGAPDASVTSPDPGKDGVTFKPQAWQDQGQGNDGKDGGDGASGDKGHNGLAGMNAPPKLVVVALEVDIQNDGHLVIDWGGQDGGNGGRGQNGGKGGNGMNGREGQSDTTWPGTGCDRSPGNGGDGGDGGNGGTGGDGGQGGKAGDIIVISTPANISPSGVFNGPHIIFVTNGGHGGAGGGSGVGGPAGAPGGAGFPTSECNPAAPGQGGNPGVPNPPFPPPIDSDPNRGAAGPTGASGHLNLEKADPGTCADMLPTPMQFDVSGLQPKVHCRCFSGPGTGDGSITGQFLDQVASVSSSLANVTVTIKPSSTDTELDLHFQIAANSGTGVGDLIFTPVLGPSQTLTGAIEIRKCQVTSISPASGAKGGTLTVTILGQCFDPSAGFHDVVVSGLGVDALNIVVVDDQTIQCVFSINALAGSGARDVTVKAGPVLSPCQHTLIGAFTVT